MNVDPREEYEKRREQSARSLDHLEGRSLTLANVRLGVFVGAALTGWWAWSGAGAVVGWAACSLGALFVTLVALHARVDRLGEEARSRVAWYQAGLDRLDHRWVGKGRGGDHWLPPDHLCGADLSVFGTGSLFERLNTTTTFMGERCLAAWLLDGADAVTVLARQAAVSELTPAISLRESLALTAREAGRDPSERRLMEWAARPSPSGERWIWRGAIAVSAVGVGAVAAGILGVGGGMPLLIWALLVWGAHRLSRTYREAVSLGVAGVGVDLRALGIFLEALGEVDPDCDKLRGLKDSLSRRGGSAPSVLGRLERLVVLRDAKRNQLAAPLAFFLVSDLYLSVAIERWRDRYGEELTLWLLVVGEWDALLAMGAYAYESPKAVFPTFPPPTSQSRARFCGRELRHPLLPRDECVPNDVTLGEEPAVWMVSGSNMSGKSTLLRTVGSNVLLALLGVPVHASSLELTPMRVGATLRIHDSLFEGRSRFFAEVSRLGEMLRQARESRPLLFLIDEIFHGTNSGDRSVGAQALVKEFLERGAVGLVTTHDLALAEGVESLSPRVQNVHLRDSVVQGELTFDYKVHPGVLVHSNALHLMRAVGLRV